MNHQSSSFFERYQTFFSIVIAGALIAGGIILAKSNTSPSENTQGIETQVSVTEDMTEIAKDLGLPKKTFEVCLENKTTVERVTDATSLAESAGVQGTPTFVVMIRNGETFTQVPLVGARDLATFEQVIATKKIPADQDPNFTIAPVVLAETDHWKGPKDASVVIVKYSDIDCPFCKRAWSTLDELLAKNPSYALVYRHSPIVSLHPFAPLKAQAAECAYDIGGDEAFWKFLDQVAR